MGKLNASDCTCHSDITEKVMEQFKAAQPEALGHRVELQGYGFAVIGRTMVMRPFMQVKTSADFPLKKGGTKWKTKTMNLVFSHCPFCGVKFNTTTGGAHDRTCDAGAELKDGAA